MSEPLLIFPEPELEFGHGQSAALPHDGLAVFGPYDHLSPHHPATLSYGLVGTEDGVAMANQFFRAIAGHLDNERERERLWPNFPGFEAAFCSKLPERPTFVGIVDQDLLWQAAQHGDKHRRASAVVDKYMEVLRTQCERDQRVSVVVCVVPEFVYKNCRPESVVRGGVGGRPSRTDQKALKNGQRLMFDSVDPAIYQMSEDFRRQLKARVMELDMPVQIVRESTLALRSSTARGDRHLTPLSDRAWNVGVALYYKAGAKPWKIRTARRNVCYVGLAYRRQGKSGPTACCAAQMFVDSGDGVVFRGRFGPWWSAEKNEFHLSRDAAAELLEGVLQTYRDNHPEPIEEIFLHCRSWLNDEE